MRNEVLQGALTPDQKKLGFWLAEDDESLVLYKEMEVVARFTRQATIENIRKAADEFPLWRGKGVKS